VLAGMVLHETRIIMVRHHPSVSTICLPNVISCDQISQALPPLYLHTASNHGKYWRWEQPGNKATYKAHAVESSPSGEWPPAPTACITHVFCGEHLLAIAVVP